MNSWKFNFFGLVVITLSITSLMASPMEVYKKSAADVIKASDARTEKVGYVISASDIESPLGINGGSLNREGSVVHNEGRPDCAEGEIIDCSGDGDCCPETWIGDGFPDCEDQQYGCDLTCYDNDGGDCDAGGTTTTTTTGGGNCDEVIWSTTMTFDWYCTGTPGSATMNLCANGVADLEGTYGTWVASGTEWPAGDGLCPGETITNDLMFVFDNYTTKYVWDTEGDDIYTPGAGYHDDEGYNGADNADGLTCVNGSEACNTGGGTTGGTTTSGECPAGTVEDCVDDDCCPETWIGDGFPDCEDQQYGCDLTCYDNDGGDCGATTGGTTTGTTTGGDCPAGTIQDCVDDDCCPESWIGDGFEDCEDQQYGCDLTCYDNDGGDCGGGTTTTTTTTGGGDAYATYTMTFDWYCTGSPGSATMYLYEDGTANLEGTAGTWMADNGEVVLGDGLCPGDTFDNDLTFMFDAYSTVYMWDQSDAGLCSDGVGYHDDTAYNGTNIDGLTSLTYLSGECEDTDPCDGQAGGDTNADGSVDVLDVVGIVNHILAGGIGLEGCNALAADYNLDESVDVLDVVAIVNLILSGGGRTADATEATLIQTDKGVQVSANGYIGGIQISLSHSNDFNIELTDNAFIAEYVTNGNTTKMIVINPETEEIFTSYGDYTIDEILVTNSQEFIDVVNEMPVSFTLSNAYPNPFNPTTTLTLDMSEQAFASVKVFNLRGEVAGVLMNDMVEAGSYTMTWDASDLSSGVYMIRAEANGQIATQKVMLVK